MTEPRGPAHFDYDIRSPFRSYFRVARDLIVEPEAFFRTVRGGSLWGPTFFVLVTYLLPSLLALLISAPILIYVVPSALREYFDLGNVGIVVFIVVAFVAVLVLGAVSGVISTLVGALIWHPFVAVSVGIGRGHGFRETYRIGAYQSLPYVLGSWVPLIGILLAMGGMAFVGVFGVKGAHGASTARAVVAVAIPLVLTIMLFVGAIVTLVVVSDNASR